MSKDFIVQTSAAVSPDEFTDSFDYDEAIEFINDVDREYGDVDFTIRLLYTLIGEMQPGDFEYSKEDILNIACLLEELVGN